MPRVLFLLPWLEMGGSNKFNLDLLTCLAPRGYQFFLCVTLPSQNLWQPLFEPWAAEIIDLPKQCPLAEQPQALLELIKAKQIDLILISHSYLAYLLLPLLRSHFPHLTYVDYTHIEEPAWKNGGYPRAAVLYQELLDLNIVSTRHLKTWMAAQGGDPERIAVCYTNIDPNYWDPAQFNRSELRQRLAVTPETTLILFAGRLVQQKRPHLLAEVIQRLAQIETLNFVCLVAGDGPDLPFLQEYIRQHHLQERLRLLGAVQPEQMRQLQAAADIFFLPSQHEGLSLAIFEAMAMQTVPVGAAVGGQAELVTPECGYLIPPGDEECEAYIAALKQLIELPQQRQRMAQAGRERIIQHFSLDQMTGRMLDLFRQAGELAQISPRPLVSAAIGLACATMAIQYTQLERSAETWWQESQQASAGAHTAEAISRRVPLKELLKAIGFKIANKMGRR